MERRTLAHLDLDAMGRFHLVLFGVGSLTYSPFAYFLSKVPGQPRGSLGPRLEAGLSVPEVFSPAIRMTKETFFGCERALFDNVAIQPKRRPDCGAEQMFTFPYLAVTAV